MLRDNIFNVMKISILLLIIIVKLKNYNLPVYDVIMVPSEKYELLLDDVFKLYVAIMIIYIFWPWREKGLVLSMHDKIFAVTGGILLLTTMNIVKILTNVEHLVI